MDAGKLLQLLVANADLIALVAGGLGLLGYAAVKIRQGVKAAEDAAAKTRTLVDDVIVAKLKPHALEVADLIEKGDFRAVKAKVKEAEAVLKKAKKG